MKLLNVTIQRFQNFTNAQTIHIEGDVTCLVGRNESGKTTVLKALHRLNPANGTNRKFRLTPEYPMAHLSRDRRNGAIEDVRPVSAQFSLDADDLVTLEEFGVTLPCPNTRLVASRTYGNELLFELDASFSDILSHALGTSQVHQQDTESMPTDQDFNAFSDWAETKHADLKAENEAARAKAIRDLKKVVEGRVAALGPLPDEANDIVLQRLPKFFYFSEYGKLPGTCDLEELSSKIDNGPELTDSEQTIVALLDFANEEPADFLDEDFTSRKAELQAAGAELSEKVFEFWRQNQDLAVTFETDMPIVAKDAQQRDIRHRTLHILLRDDRHGGVETNFETRSAGFQWFFSFLAAFSSYQNSDEPVIVLLDEPGTSLHGEAQRDFVRYIYEELGASKQVIYTTHSQFMIDPLRYETIRAVHDRATRDNRDAGVVVTSAGLAADRDTTLPVEAALGYSIAQHLLLGSGHHLVVEGSSDFIFLSRVSEYLQTTGRVFLDPRLAILPVGSAENVAPFVALFGRRIPLSVLIDGETSSRQHQRITKAAQNAAMVDEDSIVLCSDVLADGPRTADIEDLFYVDDYLWLYSRAIGELTRDALSDTAEPLIRRINDARGKYDHVLPAHELQKSSNEFFEQVRSKTLDNFEALFVRLNQTLTSPS